MTQSQHPDGPVHGEHTLRLWRGTIVGFSGDDVFVEIGPRMQGVISERAFLEPPQEGEEYEFTLGGREDSLWALSLSDERSLSSWEDMQVGSLVKARAICAFNGGLQLKIGPLHAYMPKSHLGLPRGHKIGELVGKNLTCEVIEVESERQRVIVSRKLVRRREKEKRARSVTGLLPGAVVSGRVSRLEPYGAFVSLPGGREGLVHIKELAWERPEHPSDLYQLNQSIKVKVLYVRRGGKRIGLTVKQLETSPWVTFERQHPDGDVVQGVVQGLADFGVFVRVAPGVIGLVHNKESQPGGDRRLRDVLREGQELSVRILDVDSDHERLELSLLHASGARIEPEEAAGRRSLAELALELGAKTPATTLGRLLADALHRRADAG